jgi:tetratricopeptide (TPR) repeat protein
MLVTERLALFSFIFFLFVNISAQVYPDKNIDKNLTLALDYAAVQNYNSAELILRKIDRENKNLPIGKIFLAGMNIAKSLDYAEDFDKKKIYSELDKAEKISDSLINSDLKNPWYKYFAGLTNAYKAYFHAEEGNYLSALIKGFSAISYFKDCLELDSTFYEAKVALGIYTYWKSHKIKDLDFLPFVTDNRKNAIDIIEDALRKTTYNKSLSIHSLFWIYANEKEYKKAATLAELALKVYPNSRIFLSDYAHALKQIDKPKSIIVYKKLLAIYQALKPNNRVNEIITKHKLAIVYSEMNNKTEAKRICKEILRDKNIPTASKIKLHDRLERVLQLKNELEEN